MRRPTTVARGHGGRPRPRAARARGGHRCQFSSASAGARASAGALGSSARCRAARRPASGPRRLGGLLLGLLLAAARRRGRSSRRRPGRRAAKVFSWSGPLSARPAYSGTPSVLARGQLLQRGLPVEAGPDRRGRGDQRVEEPVHDRRAASEAPGRGRPRRSGPRGCRRGSRPCRGRRSPPRRGRAGCRRRGRARGPRSASARMLTTAARSLASCPSGEVGVAAVQRVGDDHARARSRRGTPGARWSAARRSRTRTTGGSARVRAARGPGVGSPSKPLAQLVAALLSESVARLPARSAGVRRS